MNRKYNPLIWLSLVLMSTIIGCKKDPVAPSDNYIVTTFAGIGVSGYADGNGANAKFNGPEGIATDAQGNIYVVDAANYRIRKITPTATVSTLAGSGKFGYADGNLNMAEFRQPRAAAIDGQGNVYVTDETRIRKITTSGEVSTYAGDGTGGFSDSNISSAQFRNLTGIAIDQQGNIYVADYGNQRIRKITSAGMVSTLAGNGVAGFVDGNGGIAQFYNPLGLTADPEGNIYVADYANRRVRKITPSGVVSTLASIGSFPLTGPSYVASDIQGNIYVTESSLYSYQRVHKISPSGTTTVVAGNATGYSDGPGNTALFRELTGIALDGQGNIYIAEYLDNRIRKISKK